LTCQLASGELTVSQGGVEFARTLQLTASIGFRSTTKRSEVSTRSEIEDLLYQYAHGFDSNDLDLMAGCYTTDATASAFDGDVEGRDTIRARSAVFRNRFAESGAQPRHAITNVRLLSESPTQVQSRCYFTFSLATEGSVAVVTTGCYVDTWVRDGESWRIKHRTVENDTKP
jgi:3-phenylpropionate/cinnamic acid dioxygenase small subunit